MGPYNALIGVAVFMAFLAAIGFADIARSRRRRASDHRDSSAPAQ